jgi:hypothetical protein
MRTASWVIRETATGRIVCETYSAVIVAALNTARYEAVPILQYLQELNRAIKAGTIPSRNGSNLV